jgi:hypothetical protein
MENKDNDRLGDPVSSNDNSERQGAKDRKEGFFTRRLSWWQLLLGLLFVGYLVYGKYQEAVVTAGGPSQSVPAKTQ